MEENNKLIAEFIGYKIENKKFQSLEYHSSNESSWEWNEGEIVTLNGNEVSDSSQEPYFSLEDLPFDSDWDYLMEAVQKIRNNPFVTNVNYNIEGDFIIEGLTSTEKLDIIINREDFKSDLEMCYFGVVEFIKWYNQNKEKEN